MRSFKASLNTGEKQKETRNKKSQAKTPFSTLARQHGLQSAVFRHPFPRPLRSFSTPRGTKAPHTDLIDLSIGAISNHFHQLKNPSRVLGREEGEVIISKGGPRPRRTSGRREGCRAVTKARPAGSPGAPRKPPARSPSRQRGRRARGCPCPPRRAGRGRTHPQGRQVDVHQAFSRRVVRHLPRVAAPRAGERASDGQGLGGAGARAAQAGRRRRGVSSGLSGARRARATGLTPWRGGPPSAPTHPPGVARRLRPRRPARARLHEPPGAGAGERGERASEREAAKQRCRGRRGRGRGRGAPTGAAEEGRAAPPPPPPGERVEPGPRPRSPARVNIQQGWGSNNGGAAGPRRMAAGPRVGPGALGAFPEEVRGAAERPSLR